MTTVSEGAGDPSQGLGERLLKFIPSRSQSSDQKKSQSRTPFLSQLVNMGAQDSVVRLAFMGILAALCGTGVMFFLNTEAKEVENQGYSVLIAVVYAVLLVVYRASQNRLIRESAKAVEAALDRKRQRVIEDVLHLSLRDIEQLEGGHLREGMAAKYSAFSQTLVPLIAGIEGLIVLIFMFAYVLSISVFTGVLSIVVLSLTIIGYLNKSKQMDIDMANASKADSRFSQLTDSVVLGAKELQLSLLRRNALQETMSETSQVIAEGRTTSAKHFSDIITTGTTISYLLAGAVVFILPLVSGHESADISRVVIAVIFLLGPIGTVVQAMQQYATAQFTLGAINAFEAEVDACRQSTEATIAGYSTEINPDDFSELKLENLRYQHLGEQSFAIEDINLQLKRGETLFLTGGNGSGKTTLLRILTGLYPRAAGKMSLDGHDLPTMPPQDYRELFSSVFSDFHLFDRPYGLDDQGMQRFEHWLKELGVRDKLGENLGQLPAARLSTGQRKRLALAYVLAEQRPILVLDEWAADQDPQTRQRFYEQILPQLKSSGYTIFCVTHDEHYFHCCDRRVHMIEGRLSEETPE